MVYRKGELSPAGVDRGWPYQVAVRIEVGSGLGYLPQVGPLSAMCWRQHELTDGKHRYRIYCFADPDQAAEFKRWSGGEDFDPRDRGRGFWYRGRGAARDRRRSLR